MLPGCNVTLQFNKILEPTNKVLKSEMRIEEEIFGHISYYTIKRKGMEMARLIMSQDNVVKFLIQHKLVTDLEVK